MLEAKCQNRENHLRSCISHISKARKKLVAITLDNADQRTYAVQQEAFIVAENFAKHWNAVVFFAIRPSTFFMSKQSGTLSAYQNRVFTISPPRIDQAIELRLRFALELATGRLDVAQLQHIRLELGNVAIFLRGLLQSLRKNREIIEFLDNICGGNVRQVINLISRFIGSANVDSERYIREIGRQGWHYIPTHEFWKSALLGDHQYFDSSSSVAMNVYDVVFPDEKAHFLVPMILAYLGWSGPHRRPDGFIHSDQIVTEMQQNGFGLAAIEDALRRMNNKLLIEAPKRLTFSEDEAGLHGDLERSFRLTSVGAYHSDRWLSEFSYLDAMCIDTPIFDRDVREKIGNVIESFTIQDRHSRAVMFRNYLTAIWSASGLSNQYFDWPHKVSTGNKSFTFVERALRKPQHRK